jgi:hypothetical protein
MPPQGLSRLLSMSVAAGISTVEDGLVVQMPVPLLNGRCPPSPESNARNGRSQRSAWTPAPIDSLAKWYVNSYETLNEAH